MSARMPQMLAIDDDPLMGDVVRSIGERAWFRVTTATSPASFKEALANCKPDLVLLDLQMPGQDGVQLLRVLADGGNRAGIMLVSGMDERTIAAAEQYGSARGLRMLGTLQKPFSADELLAKLTAISAASRPLTGEDLRDAIERNELVVHYQPTIQRFADGSWDVVSMEALVRWVHPTRGVLAPEEFIPLSEQQGLGRAVTDYVIERGIEQLKGWQAARLNLGLRVNVPAILISDVDFPDRLEAILLAQELDPGSLTIEITETAMLERQPDTIDILTRLRVKNINLAIDDFGIGYSSLTQLFEMPFNEMKIDKSLVMRLQRSKEAKIMVEVLVDLAHKLNLKVCAEGVESQETLDFLAQTACDSAQGFFVSPPAPASAVQNIVRSWERRREHARDHDDAAARFAHAGAYR